LILICLLHFLPQRAAVIKGGERENFTTFGRADRQGSDGVEKNIIVRYERCCVVNFALVRFSKLHASTISKHLIKISGAWINHLNGWNEGWLPSSRRLLALIGRRTERATLAKGCRFTLTRHSMFRECRQIRIFVGKEQDIFSSTWAPIEAAVFGFASHIRWAVFFIVFTIVRRHANSNCFKTSFHDTAITAFSKLVQRFCD